MNVFELRDRLIDDYRAYVESFLQIRDPRIKAYVQKSLSSGVLWPDPLLQMNPAFESGGTIDELVAHGVLYAECARIFRLKHDARDQGTPLSLHRHQAEAVRIARTGANYVLTTGTGSGKSLSYIVPIVDHVLRRGPGRGIQAIVVYPMNALANSQEGELEKFLHYGYPDGKGPLTFAKYTGQESDETRQAIMRTPPDILLTNYVMLELILTRPIERPLINAAQELSFLVLDEMHTYRGRQGADVALLVRRVRDRLASPAMQVVGTSATLAGEGSLDEQRQQVARVATQLFGAPVRPEHVIGETLRRVTPERSPSDPAFVRALRARVSDPSIDPPRDYAGFIADPLSSWLESTFGVTADPQSGRLVRARPSSITSLDGAADQLSRVVGVAQRRCAEAIQGALLGAYEVVPDAAASEGDGLMGRTPFAFRLHQFISRGDVVYVSLDEPDRRFITMQGQRFQPHSRDHVLLPLAFCRECGQEYVSVQRVRADGIMRFLPRELADQADDANGEAGFLYISADRPWPTEAEAVLDRVPSDWVETVNGVRRLVSTRRRDVPQAVTVAPDGTASEPGLVCHFIGAPFRFCLQCGISYDPRQRSDFAKLSTLSSEGRSTATTVLSLSAIEHLREDATLPPRARKLLSFTDNRQDASLQAGHFNDFIEIGMLRGALYRAVLGAPEGLTHDTLTQQVFDALALPMMEYAADPSVKFQALRETEKALRDVLGYRLYRDLKRGWRITSPNLEQVGLLDVAYLSLDDVCADEETWAGSHAALATAPPQTRREVARTLLDFMRRELAIKVSYLQQDFQERLRQQSDQRLNESWALDDNEADRMEYATVLYPRSRGGDDSRVNVYLSGRSGFGQYLRRPTTFPQLSQRASVADANQIIADLLAGLQVAGLVEMVAPASREGEVPGYQIPASALRWTCGAGTHSFRDPIRVPNPSEQAAAANAFFVDFYTTVAANLGGMEAREHTAQVPYNEREKREQAFREGKLPILYCSPTMELGVDISELNVVNLRNVPPTPANYAQRSGRAGRSGQPALVFSYCTMGSPHDQYFFRHQDAMVAGAVTPPRLDLANEDLVRSHVHAIWLAETGLGLGRSLKDLLELSGEPPALTLLASVRDDIERSASIQHARAHAARVLDSLGDELRQADWYVEGWLDEVLAGAARQFDQTCERWRTLYRAAFKQWTLQNRIIGDASRSAGDKDHAKRLRREAESQMELLTEVNNIGESDFYSYRYFASEGFLPGYSFPRLPISAFIPARRIRQRERDQFLSRPRFLAIAEFGPRSIVYHEGSRYVINKAILPVADLEADDPRQRIALREAKLCETCGYLHPVTEDGGPDVCQHCGVVLGPGLRQLFRLQNVSTRRRDRITSDEEERMRFGFEILTGVRFGEQGGHASARMAMLESGTADRTPLARLLYGSAATLWRINLGWSRRRNRDQYGFGLDLERGYWQRDEQVQADDDTGDPLSGTVARVIPFVEDRRNCLLFEPVQPMTAGELASLMAALKNAMQVRFQLEDSELAAEVLPSRSLPKQILFYEAAEGGAGVLRRLLDDPEAVAQLARTALDLCHFDPDTGADRFRAPHAREDCEAACYDCLMSYGNQRFHQLLDRQLIRPFLLACREVRVQASPAAIPRAAQLEQLLRVAGSDLEQKWLRFLEARNLRLPTRAQALVEACHTRPDFLYDGDYSVAIYVDGPVHRNPERSTRDATQTEAMEDLGFLVIRFGAEEDWDSKVARFPHVFGKERQQP
jgi:ATP-dependent helicase YprA (DUF1998 family)/very-short-patch-repair endonuclease